MRVCDVAKLGKDGKPETCRPITKIDYRTVRNRLAFASPFRPTLLAILLPMFHVSLPSLNNGMAILLQFAGSFIQESFLFAFVKSNVI